MFLKSLQIVALISTLIIVPCLAQNNGKEASNAGIGSVVLHQDGDKNRSYENGAYSYEQIIDIPGTAKAALYDRVKKWVIATLKTPQESLFFDDANKASITANTAVRLKDNLRLSSQMIEFKLTISFKDDKVRLQATDFVYRSVYPGTLYQKPFQDLRPFAKSLQRTIYEEFDGKFEAMLKGLSTAVKSDRVDNW